MIARLQQEEHQEQETPLQFEERVLEEGTVRILVCQDQEVANKQIWVGCR
jgi:hypothetical protein